MTAPMTGEELVALRRRTGFKRARFCGELAINTNELTAFEKNQRAVPTEVAARARRLDGQGTSARRIGIATFGEKFVVVQFSLFDELDVWRVDVLPMVHDNRASAVIAARDFASLHGHEFAAIGFPVEIHQRSEDDPDGGTDRGDRPLGD